MATQDLNKEVSLFVSRIFIITSFEFLYVQIFVYRFAPCCCKSFVMIFIKSES